MSAHEGIDSQVRGAALSALRELSGRRIVSVEEVLGCVSRQSWGSAWTEDLEHTVVALYEALSEFDPPGPGQCSCCYSERCQFRDLER